MSTEPTRTQERTDSADRRDAPDADADGDATVGPHVTGPHDGYDRDGRLDHRYWRCERCGLETTDPQLREGCFRCGAGREGRDAE